MDEDTRLQARELLLRSRIYRFTAVLFAVVGLVVFIYLFFTRMQGDISHVLGNPAIVAVILFPFLPAVVVSWMAVRAENRFLRMLGQPDDPPVEDGKKAKDKKK